MKKTLIFLSVLLTSFSLFALGNNTDDIDLQLERLNKKIDKQKKLIKNIEPKINKTLGKTVIKTVSNYKKYKLQEKKNRLKSLKKQKLEAGYRLREWKSAQVRLDRTGPMYKINPWDTNFNIRYCRTKKTKESKINLYERQVKGLKSTIKRLKLTKIKPYSKKMSLSNPRVGAIGSISIPMFVNEVINDSEMICSNISIMRHHYEDKKIRYYYFKEIETTNYIKDSDYIKNSGTNQETNLPIPNYKIFISGYFYSHGSMNVNGKTYPVYERIDISDYIKYNKLVKRYKELKYIYRKVLKALNKKK